MNVYQRNKYIATANKNELVGLIEKDIERMNHVNCLTMLKVILKKNIDIDDIYLHKIFRCLNVILQNKKCATSIESRHFSSFFWLIANLLKKNKQLSLQLRNTIRDVSVHLFVIAQNQKLVEISSAQEISITMWSVAVIMQYDSTLIMSKKRKRLDRNLLLPAILNKLTNRFGVKLGTDMISIEPQAVSNMIWSLNKLNALLPLTFDQTLLFDCSKHMCRFISDYKYQELSNCCWAFKQFGVSLDENVYISVLKHLKIHSKHFPKHNFFSIFSFLLMNCNSKMEPKLLRCLDIYYMHNFKQELTENDLMSFLDNVDSVPIDIVKFFESKIEQQKNLISCVTFFTLVVKLKLCFQFSISFKNFFFVIIYEPIEFSVYEKLLEGICIAVSSPTFNVILEQFDEKRFLDSFCACLENDSFRQPKYVINSLCSLYKIKATFSYKMLSVVYKKFLVLDLCLLTSRDVCQLAWFLAVTKQTIKHKDESCTKLLKEIAGVAENNLHQYNSQECSKLLYALKISDIDYPALFKKASKKNVKNYTFYPRSLKKKNRAFKVKLEYALAGGRTEDINNREDIGTTASTGIAIWQASEALAHYICDTFIYTKTSKFNATTISKLHIFSKKDIVIELGAGTGLPSLCSFNALNGKVNVIATDGDEKTFTYLKQNCSGAIGKRQLICLQQKWGDPLSCQLKAAVKRCRGGRYIIGSGLLYGNESAVHVWEKLFGTILKLSNDSTTILLAHGQGAARGVHSTKGRFFELASNNFEISSVVQRKFPQCIIHVMRPKKNS